MLRRIEIVSNVLAFLRRHGFNLHFEELYPADWLLTPGYQMLLGCARNCGRRSRAAYRSARSPRSACAEHRGDRRILSPHTRHGNRHFWCGQNFPRLRHRYQTKNSPVCRMRVTSRRKHESIHLVPLTFTLSHGLRLPSTLFSLIWNTDYRRFC